MNLATFAGKHIKGYSHHSDFKRTKLAFDEKAYLKNSLDYRRIEMPQIEFYEVTKMINRKETLISTGETSASNLRPSQNEINLEKVLKKIAKGKFPRSEYVYIVSKDWRIIDGHHKHVHTLMLNPSTPVKYIRFNELDAHELIFIFNSLQSTSNKAIDESLEVLLETYGQQSPAAVPGMGAVDFGNVATNTAQAMNPENRGSGDVPDVKKKKLSIFSEELFTEFKENLRKLLSKTNAQTNESVLDLPLDDSHPLADVLDVYIDETKLDVTAYDKDKIDTIRPDKKDKKRADTLQLSGKSKYDNNAPFKAKTLAQLKAIRDPEKMIRRCKAFVSKYGTGETVGVVDGNEVESSRFKLVDACDAALARLGFDSSQISTILK